MNDLEFKQLHYTSENSVNRLTESEMSEVLGGLKFGPIDFPFPKFPLPSPTIPGPTNPSPLPPIIL
jgi:hypothetical protein